MATSTRSLLDSVVNLTSNPEANQKLKNVNLNISCVAWEDTSRYAGSCWGSNISDMTLQVANNRMPLIRSDNFKDVTVDLPLDKLPLLVVGNENRSPLSRVSLQDYLSNFQNYNDTHGKSFNFWNDRDVNVLTSAQACVLPLDNGKVEFAVDLYNYQSSSTEPAVLVVMATAYGTSSQVVCGGNTVLYFNDAQTSRLFKAERLTDYRVSQGKKADGEMTSEEKALNGIYIFQIPLKVKRFGRAKFYEKSSKGAEASFYCDSDECAMTFESLSVPNARSVKGMERAILTLGEEKGPYKGIKKNDGSVYEMERDTDRPVRLTVQFYMCTDTNTLSDANVAEIASQIRKIYEQGCNEGSLVVDGTTEKPGLKSESKPSRPTATKPSSVPTAFLANSSDLL
jgi:hypothetical protein